LACNRSSRRQNKGDSVVDKQAPRECHRPPWNITEVGDLAKVEVDFQEAEKRAKRTTKRSGTRA